MRCRRAWIWLGLVCLGCQALVRPPAGEEPTDAVHLWLQGQAAMHRGQAGEAIDLYEQSLAADPQRSRTHLSLAAACLETGDLERAHTHLARYVAANPDQLGYRVFLAELLIRLGRPDEARREFEHVEAEAPDRPEVPRSQMIQCHSRLMEIAEAADEPYAEHLHRGIGLYLLARERAALTGAACELSPEGLLFKAAGELTLARRERPDEARPLWYLYEVWSQLAQHQPALCCLRQARTAVPFSPLPPAERRALQLACQCHLTEGCCK